MLVWCVFLRNVLSPRRIFFLTEGTEFTDVLSLRVPSGFDLSPTDDTDCSDLLFYFSITRFARDFVFTRHNPNKFGFCSRLLQNSLVLDAV